MAASGQQQFTSPIPGQLLGALAGASASNEARLRLLERRFVIHGEQDSVISNSFQNEQDGLEQDVSDNSATESALKRRRKAQAGSDVQQSLAPGASAPRAPLGAAGLERQQALQQQCLQRASFVEPAVCAPQPDTGAMRDGFKRKRNSSPMEQRSLLLASSPGKRAGRTCAPPLCGCIPPNVGLLHPCT